MKLEDEIDLVLSELRTLLLRKNKAYGESALEPLRVFAKSDALEGLRVRIDDKLSRLRNAGETDDEDTVRDLAGYLVLYMVARKRADVATISGDLGSHSKLGNLLSAELGVLRGDCFPVNGRDQ